MSDNITLPRELVKHLKWVLEEGLMHGDCTERSAIEALRTALAAPKQEHFAVLAIACKDKEIDRLTDENEALRRDAERYRWLRGMIYDDRIIVSADTMLYGEALDAAIDAAMGDKT